MEPTGNELAGWLEGAIGFGTILKSDRVMMLKAAARLRVQDGRERFDCPECGKGVKADEDGCCASCGRDTVLAQDGERIAVYVEKVPANCSCANARTWEVNADCGHFAPPGHQRAVLLHPKKPKP